MVVCGGINTDIGKIEVERDEDSFLCLRGTKHSWIRVPAQLFGKHSMDIVTGLLKQDRSITREILVEFESDRHPTRLSGNRNDTFPR